MILRYIASLTRAMVRLPSTTIIWPDTKRVASATAGALAIAATTQMRASQSSLPITLSKSARMMSGGRSDRTVTAVVARKTKARRPLCGRRKGQICLSGPTWTLSGLSRVDPVPSVRRQSYGLAGTSQRAADT
jgi:hypothetical protein